MRERQVKEMSESAYRSASVVFPGFEVETHVRSLLALLPNSTRINMFAVLEVASDGGPHSTMLRQVAWAFPQDVIHSFGG
jgi:hypothetical protein